jgi:peptide/nickel transport system substrate-binding protein
MRRLSRLVAHCLAVLVLAACGKVWNDPYPAQDRGKNILYSAFIDRPKHLDPVQSYSEDEITFTAQIYEPPLQYHYLKRPYQVVPATALEVPKPTFYAENGERLPEDADAAKIAYSVYEIHIRPGILYQPHPALAKDAAGRYRYHELRPEDLQSIYDLRDFKEAGTRELSADDYVYEIKRLAHPRLHSPIFGLMSEYIPGLKELGDALAKFNDALPAGERDDWIDLRRFPLSGVEVVDRHTYRIKIRGKYPQFVYWLTMPFFAPMPWEADKFHSQPGMAEKNLTLDWYPIGTGPYMLTENNPNSRMVLARNPNFRGEPYPCEGEAGDREAGLLADCGKTMPFVDTAVFTREKEQIPYWTKFLQGYYDASGISSDSFDQAVQVSGQGEVTLTDDMRKQGIRLLTSVSTSTFYMGFNWLDAVVGGSLGGEGAERARKLRQAISIAIDQEEFISIFQNGRGIPAQSPIPPGIFGYRGGRAGVNPYMYDWVNGRPQRKSVDYAKQLLAEAGYPDGRDAKTGEPLVINLDSTATGVGAKSRVDWLVKQFQKINLQLVVRSTDYNRFQEKVRKGNTQLFYWGWNADYPDPENFFFLLYGPQSKVKSQGENAANYANPEYDALFEKMKAMDNGPERQAIIDRMIAILRRDAPWVWGYHPKDYTLHHQWLSNRKPTKVGNNTLKYQRIDPVLREKLRAQWNRPVLWPIGAVVVLLIMIVLPALRSYRRREMARGLGRPGPRTLEAERGGA